MEGPDDMEDSPKLPAVPPVHYDEHGGATTPEIAALTASYLAMVQRAEDLLQAPAVVAMRSEFLIAELNAYIEWCKVPLADMVLHVLEHPTDLLPEHVCPKLFAFIQGMQMGPYKDRRLKEMQKAGQKDTAAALALLRYRRKLKLQIVGVLSQLAMCRNQLANPPWIVMRSIDQLYQGTTESGWEMLTRERLAVDRTGLRRALQKLADWRPTPPYVTNNVCEISKEYTMIIHDNKEWWLTTKWQRIKNGEIIKNPIYHTVTSKLRLGLVILGSS